MTNFAIHRMDHDKFLIHAIKLKIKQDKNMKNFQSMECRLQVKRFVACDLAVSNSF